MGLLNLIIVAIMAMAPLSKAVLVYDSIGNTNAANAALGTNFVSQGFECCSVNEFGNAVTLSLVAPLQTVEWMMSSWACQTGSWFAGTCATTPGATFNVDITLKLYDGSTAFYTATSTFAIQYRPSTSASCTGGRWQDPISGNCYNGYAQLITFTLPLVLPPSANVLATLQYNTFSGGYSPTGVQSGADSLNVAMNTVAAPYVGANEFATTQFIYGTSVTAYCDGGPLNVLRRDLDQPGGGCVCTAGGCNTPMVRINAAPPQIGTE